MKDWRALIPNLCWSRITAFILAIPKIIGIYTTIFFDDNASTIIYQHGLIKRQQESIDHYPIKKCIF